MKNKKILATTFIVRVIMTISTFGLFILSSRYLGAEGRGMISLYIANIAIVQLVSEIIFGPGYIYTAQRIFFKKIFTAGILWSFSCSIVIPVILVLTHIQSTDLFPYLIINSFFVALVTGINYQLQSYHHSFAFNIINLIQSISSLSIAWVLLYIYPSTQLFCMALSCSYVLTCLSGVYFLWKYHKSDFPSQQEDVHNSLKKSFRIGLTAQYSNFLNFLNTRIGFYLIFLILGNIKELGIFSAAAVLAESVWIISNTLATWLYPQIASAGDSTETIEKTLSNAYVAFWYSFAALFLLLLIPEFIFLAIFGSDFIGIKQYFILLIPGTLILAYGKIFWNYFAGTGQFNINNYSALISTTVAILSSIPLMHYLKITGIAISTSLSYITYACILIAVFISKNKLNIRAALPSFKLLP
jgi:O-antigen/teichoic acid export membrane protein